MIYRVRTVKLLNELVPRSAAKAICLCVTSLLLFLLVGAQSAYSQATANMFDVKRITVEIQDRYNLSRTDLKRIEPIIDQENRRIVKIYARFCGDEPEYSPRVWRQIVDDRMRFEAGLGPDLSRKQKDALRSARSRLEKRILEYLVFDYVGFVARVLELTEIEFNLVTEIFEFESEEKRRLLTVHLSDPAFLQRQLDKVSGQTTSKLRRILTAEQWRYYMELSETFELIA